MNCLDELGAWFSKPGNDLKGIVIGGFLFVCVIGLLAIIGQLTPPQSRGDRQDQ